MSGALARGGLRIARAAWRWGQTAPVVPSVRSGRPRPLFWCTIMLRPAHRLRAQGSKRRRAPLRRRVGAAPDARGGHSRWPARSHLHLAAATRRCTTILAALVCACFGCVTAGAPDLRLSRQPHRRGRCDHAAGRLPRGGALRRLHGHLRGPGDARRRQDQVHGQGASHRRPSARAICMHAAVSHAARALAATTEPPLYRPSFPCCCCGCGCCCCCCGCGCRASRRRCPT